MSNHTPGPWSYGRGENGWLVFDAHGDALFNVPYDGTGREPVDARLIAKAPQLAGALDEVTAIVETLLVHYGDQMSGEDSRAREHAADSARELLAEIRGEEAPAKEVPAGMNLRYRFGSSSRGFPER